MFAPLLGGVRGTAVELRSADFSPLPSGPRKSAGSGMNSALQVQRNSLNSTALLPGPPPLGGGEGEDLIRPRVVVCIKMPCTKAPARKISPATRQLRIVNFT